MIDRQALERWAAEHYGNQPHPDIPELKVKDYETFARTAARLFEAPRPRVEQVRQAYHLLNNAEVSPAEFERLWDITKPLANRLLGRPPSIQEIAHLQGAVPGDVHQYYLDHPHPEYPEVSAGDMARYHHAAAPIAQKAVGRHPVPLEVARFAIAGYTTDDITAHYADGKS